MENYVFTVYKVTNSVNGKFYIGVHKTRNPYDSYMGSGEGIKLAIKKYGKDKFVKQVLFVNPNNIGKAVYRIKSLKA